MVEGKYRKYVDDILQGKIPSNTYIKRACQRFLNDIDDNSKYYLDTDECDRCVAFCESLTLFKDQFANQQVKLMDWQKFFIYNVFGIKDKETNKRKYKQAFLFIPRKNSKSTLAVMCLLYQLVTSGENSEIIFVANSTKQAKIAFGMVLEFVKRMDSKGRFFKSYRDSVIFLPLNSKLFVLSSDTKQMDGYGAHYLCDEAESYKDDKIVATLRNGQASLENPLGLIISTAGYEKLYLYDLFKTSVEILYGLKKQDNLFCMLYCLEEGMDYTDEKNFIIANPSYGVTVAHDFLVEEVENSINNPTAKVSTLTKNFNVFCDVSETWISSTDIAESTMNIDLQEYKDKITTLYIGIDLASVCDLTAVSVMFMIDGTYYFKNYYYLPLHTVNTSVNSELYKKWVREKKLTVSQGKTTDYDLVLNDIMKLSNDFYIEGIFYDKWNSSQFIHECEKQGFVCKPISQSIGAFNKPTKELQRLILNGKVKIDNNPITRFCFSNVVIKSDWNDNIKPDKATNEDKIDGVIAMIQSLSGYLLSNDPYFEGDILTI